MSNILISPLAKTLAIANKIDISKIIGSGIRHRIMKKDIESFLETNKNVSKSDFNPIERIIEKEDSVILKISPIRNAIAKAIKNSWNNVGYTNLVNKIDISKLWDMRKNLNIVLEKEDIKLTFLPFIFRAVSIALKQYPIFAAKYDEVNNSLIIPNRFNIGFASDTKDGLKVPVIHNADSKSIINIAKEINSLAKASRDNTIKSTQMQGGDFTITNYGSVGSLFGVPVINYPEIAIAGVGAIIDEVISLNGQFKVAKIMYLTVAGDHRWLDGADIGRFALRVKELLENPEMLGVY